MSGLTYKDSGVDIKTAAELVGDIGDLRRRTEGKRKLLGPSASSPPPMISATTNSP